jgi:dephospho-CoA kinase
VLVPDPASAAAVADDLRAAGLVRRPGPPGEDGEVRLLSADPGCAVECRVRPLPPRGGARVGGPA